MRKMLLRVLFATMIILIVFVNISYAGILTNINVSMQNNNNVAGAEPIYTFAFKTDTGGIPADGRIVITFPSGFGIAGAVVAQTANSATMNGGLLVSSVVGQVITIDRDGTGTPVGGSAVVGIMVATIENNHTAANDYTVNVETKKSDNTLIDAGTSSIFSITHSFLDSFEFDTIGDYIAGESFNITITAIDEYGNAVENFNSTATLSDTSETISPTSTGSFASGSWSGNVQITRSGVNNEIMASALNKFGVSNKFDINPAQLNYFHFNDISGPQTAGISFNISIVAHDQYHNVVYTFVDKATLTDYSGSLNTQSDNFVAGVLDNQSVTITKKQNNNYITATDPSATKSGQSNLFNVNSGNLAKFYVSPITSPQKAGESFSITLIAQDNNDNTVSSFENRVTISDLSGDIEPTESGNFSSGQWSGNIKNGLPHNNNQITVTKFAGTETGTSNIFDVNEGDLNHFSIESISTQVAGSQFSITIKARDIEGNTVSSFTGQVDISDLSGSINRQTTDNFTNGEWTGFVIITRSKQDNRIYVTGSNKEGTSDPFDVDPGVLDHFAISEITSPQIAGQDFSISIEARDANENLITGFETQVNLADETGTISLTSTTNFIAGLWTDNINIIQKSENNKITATDPSSGKNGKTNYFNIQAGDVNHIIIRNNPAGLGVEVEDLDFNIGEQITLYAAGYDQWNNYVRDVIADWDTTGNIDFPSPIQGVKTVYNPVTPYTSGQIYADSVSVGADSTGLFTVGTIHHVLIRDAANGGGNIVVDRQITADDSLTLYAAAYDEGNSYLGSAAVDWSSNGGLLPAVSETDTFRFVFYPTTAGVSGQIMASHPTASPVSTGQISVIPGAPVGTIVLHPNPKVIAAHPDSFSTINSDVIYDFDGNAIAEGELFTVSTKLGTITTVDEEPGINGHQIKSNTESKISFIVNAGTEGGAAEIHANSIGKGSAVGDTTLIITNLKIISVNTNFEQLSRGQTNIPIRMVVDNIGTQNINIVNAGLKFTGPIPLQDNLTGEYSVTRTDGINQLLANTQSTLTFVADVAAGATTGLITIDGFVTGELSGLSVIDTSASQTQQIQIQTPPVLSIEKIEAFADTVIQNTSTTVKATIRNDGDASVVIDSDSLIFWAENLGINVTNEYGLEPHLSNLDTLVGHSSEFFTYTVLVGSNASIDTISLDGKISGRDVNSNVTISDFTSDEKDGWWVKQASDIEITEFVTSQSTVTNGQAGDWFLYMIVNNSGGADLRLDNIDVVFSLGGTDISDEYTLIYPENFLFSGDDTLRSGDTDTLKITVDGTGNTLGTITITGTVYLNDMISGQIEKNSVTGVTVQSPALLTIDYISTSQLEVTTSQTHPWQVIVSLTNNGGGDIVLDSTKVERFVTFAEEDNLFDTSPPSGFYANKNFILESGKTDSLFFTVDTTGNISGNRKIYVKIFAYEINSQQSINVEDSTEIKVELPSEIQIKKTENVAPNSPFVDTEQDFSINVIIENIGEDAATNIEVSIFSDSLSTVLNPTQNISVLQGGKKDTLNFGVHAFSNTIFEEVFSAVIDTALAENTPELEKMLIADPVDSFAVAKVQQPAQIEIVAVSLSEDTVKALSTEKWEISVAVRNNGEAGLIIEKPTANDISFSISGKSQSGYSITAPDGLQNSGGLLLSGDELDFLTYEVNQTGFRGGNASAKVTLDGQYSNTGSEFLVSDSTDVYIKPSADVSIISTEPVCFNVDQYGIGQVNTGQNFQVLVNVKNSGAERVDDVIVELAASGYTVTPFEIEHISSSGNSTAVFNLTANSIIGQLFFNARIVSATAHDSGIPATISASTDSSAHLSVHDPAELVLNIETTENVYTAGQSSYLKLSISNRGTAEVDNSGLLSVKVPNDYYLIKNEKQMICDTTNFTIDEKMIWEILPPATESDDDTIKVVVINPSKDKNTNLAAIVPDPYEYFVVKTIPSNINILSFRIISPDGAKDDTVSTRQNFNIEVVVDPSENLDSIRASIKLPDNFGFGIQEDSLKFIPSNRGTWELRAPEAASAEPGWIKVTVYGVTDGITESLQDSFAVVVQKRSEIALGRIWTSSQTDSIFSTGQVFDLNVLMKSGDPNQAKLKGDAKLRINFGATNIIMEDILEPLIKDFKVDSVVTWRLKAPEFERMKSPLTISIESIPVDENTNTPAIVLFDETSKEFYVQTVAFGNIKTENLRITTPSGAIDHVLSSYQVFNVEASVFWETCADTPYVTLRLPGGFYTEESNPKKLSPGQPGIIGWSIKAPSAAVEDQNIWLQITARDANSGNSFAINSDSIEIDVVKRPELLLNAEIISPNSALDGEISADHEFVISAYLQNEGEAGLVGNFSAKLTLPEGQDYTAKQNLTRSANFDKSINWNIIAPSSKRNWTNLIVELIAPPHDVNTNIAIPADAIINKDFEIPISTEEKSLTVTVMPDNGKNTIARGDTSISMLGLEFMVSGDIYSNNVLFSGVKVKLKDRQGNLIENPNNGISKISIVNYQNSSMIYGQLTNIPSTNPIEILFSRIDTLKPETVNQVDFRVDVAVNASITDFQLSIDSSSAFKIVEEGSEKIPKIKNDSGEALDVLDIFSTPSIIIEADFEKSFFNYPNPFGDVNKPETHFVYYLEQESDVKIQIYTIIGEPVWSRSYSKNDVQGKKGPHEGDIYWDARNDDGHKVLNGVYIARISIGNNKDAIAKIAVIK